MEPSYETLPASTYSYVSATSMSLPEVPWKAGAGADSTVAAALGNTPGLYDTLTSGAEYDFLSTDFGAEVSLPNPATTCTKTEGSAAADHEEPLYECVDGLDKELEQKRRALVVKELVTK